jgi:hypothetical protein
VVMKMRSSSKGEPRRLGNVVLLTLMLRSIIALSLIMGWFAPIGWYCSPLLLDLPLDCHDLMTRGGCFQLPVEEAASNRRAWWQWWSAARRR